MKLFIVKIRSESHKRKHLIDRNFIAKEQSSPESSTRVSLFLNHMMFGGGMPFAVHDTSMVSPMFVV